MKPNIVIITLDAVRAQNLPFYGYHRNTTPFLTSIADDLAIYENAVSSSYWTMPSIASLFTGMYTSDHGLLVDGDKLDNSFATLPSVLKQYDYDCTAYVRNFYVSEFSGLDRGFDCFYTRHTTDDFLKKLGSLISMKTLNRLRPPGCDNVFDKEADKAGAFTAYLMNTFARTYDLVMDRGGNDFVKHFRNRLGQGSKRPFFVYFHFLETHSPYRAPMRYALRFLSLRDNIRKLSVNHDHLKFLLGKTHMSEDDFKILISSYDNSISYTDNLIGQIVAILKEHGLYDNTLIIILSDHGDNVGEHGLMFHYFCLYDTLIKIPLLIKFPTGAKISGRFAEIVQNVDIFPTILSLNGITDRKIWDQVKGNDLFDKSPLKREKGFAVSELIKVFGPDRIHYKDKLNAYNRRLLSIRTKDRKFIFSSSGDHECYNLASDPAEGRNLYPDKGFTDLFEKGSTYYKKMDTFYQANKDRIDGEIKDSEIDAAVVERLKSLGYM
ncbi:MAG: hypothetical protein A2W05_06550 [Candidatus Schekmanbacteria bacterium RBG_16_38_10]|uniref:Sulfatase N-terminal domain-containing protein n=1 Tax=Candidatus Schekmanbacteria bacterium RBG_16_38_10 TaxID=1817879 RepID=A0A1F7RTL3_9BACT|nr:MAG: hypothetical protein A2W05_06550 [Candidatus Schekmanbacteria bacterium RBG_16_38_10]